MNQVSLVVTKKMPTNMLEIIYPTRVINSYVPLFAAYLHWPHYQQCSTVEEKMLVILRKLAFSFLPLQYIWGRGLCLLLQVQE